MKRHAENEEVRAVAAAVNPRVKSPSEVSELLWPDEYREKRKLTFPSEDSLQRYQRRHRQALIETGALLLIAGRWRIRADKFDAYVLEHGAGSARWPKVAA